MEKKLIPYSVHLPEALYLRIKFAAEQRKASSLIRDAIELYLKQDNVFETGRATGVEDSLNKLNQNPLFHKLSWNGSTMYEHAMTALEPLKEQKRAKKKP